MNVLIILDSIVENCLMFANQISNQSYYHCDRLMNIDYRETECEYVSHLWTEERNDSEKFMLIEKVESSLMKIKRWSLSCEWSGPGTLNEW